MVYVVGGLFLALLMSLRPPVPAFTTVVPEADKLPTLIFRNVPGAGGGGGGGNRTPLVQPKKTAMVRAITARTTATAGDNPRPGSAARVRKVEREVRLSCVVFATGAVGSCTVTRSLDGNRYAMDDEAVKAASRFMFRPATRGGKPVPVMVNIIIEFRMR